MSERFMVDDAGTLIDMYIRDTFDYVSDVCDLLNELHEENEYLCEKIKENEWHWNTIDEDRDVWMYKCKRLEEENEQLKEENNKLHQKIFEMRTNIALERTEISRQTYTGKKNEKEYLDVKEFLDEIEKW